MKRSSRRRAFGPQAEIAWGGRAIARFRRPTPAPNGSALTEGTGAYDGKLVCQARYKPQRTDAIDFGSSARPVGEGRLRASAGGDRPIARIIQRNALKRLNPRPETPRRRSPSPRLSVASAGRVLETADRPADGVAAS